MSDWETVGKANDGWEDVSGWETVSPPKRKTTLGEDFGIGLGQAGSTVAKGVGLLAGGALGALGFEDARDTVFDKSKQIAKETQDYWTPQDAEQSFGGKVASMVSTFPAQLAAMPFSPADTGTTMLDSGETLDKAITGTLLDTAGSTAGLLINPTGGIGKRVVQGAGLNAGQDYLTRRAISDLSDTQASKEHFAPTLETTGLAATMGGGFGLLPSANNVKVQAGDSTYANKKIEQQPEPSWDYRKDAEGAITTIDTRLEGIANQLARQTDMNSEYSLKLQEDARTLQNQRIRLELALGKDEIKVGETKQDADAVNKLELDKYKAAEARLLELESEYKIIRSKGAALKSSDREHLSKLQEEHAQLSDYLEYNAAKFLGEDFTNPTESVSVDPTARVERPEFEPKTTRSEVHQEVMQKDYSSMPVKYIESAWQIKNDKLNSVTAALIEAGLGSERGQKLLSLRDTLTAELEHIELALNKRNKMDAGSQKDFMALKQEEVKSWELAPELRKVASEEGLGGALRFLAEKAKDSTLSAYGRYYGELANKLLENPLIKSKLVEDANMEHAGAYSNRTGDIYLQDLGTPEVLLHETVHSGVNKALMHFDQGTLTDPRQLHAATKINELHQSLLSKPNRAILERFLGKENASLVLENTRELVAYGMSDLRTQLALNQIKLGTATAWSRLTTSIKDMFNLNKNERTALDDVLNYGEQLLESSDGKAFGEDSFNFARKRSFTPEEAAAAIRNGSLKVFSHLFTQNLPQMMRHDPHFTALEKKIADADRFREKVAREAGYGKESQQAYNDSSKVFFKLSAKEHGTAVIPTMQKMSNKELGAGMRDLVQGMREGISIPDTIAKHPEWTPNQKQLAQAIDKAVNVLWEAAIRMLGRNDLDPSLKQKMGYILTSRSGKHAVQVSVGGVPVRFESYMTAAEADRRAAMFKQQSGGKADVLRDNTDNLTGRTAADNLIDFLEASQNLSGPELTKHINDTFDRLTRESSAIGQHSKVSSVLAGFAGDQAGISLEKSGELWRDSIPRSINEYAQSIMNREVMKNVVEWHIDNDGKMSKTTGDLGDFYAKTQIGRPYTEGTFRDDLRKVSDSFKEVISTAADKVFGTELRDKHAFDRFMGVFGSAFYIANITMKPAIWVAQPLQALQSVRSAFKEHETPFQVAAAFGDALKTITTGKIFADKDFANALFHVSQEGNTLHPQMMNEFNEIKFGHDPNAWYNKMFQVANGQMISAAGDKFSRFASFAFFYHLHKRSGLTGVELWNKAAKDTTDNMVGYGSKKMPAIYREMGLFGEQGSPLTTFAHTQAGNMIVDVKEFVQGWKQSFEQRKLDPGFRNTAPLAMTAIIMMATGGAMSLPILAEYELLRLAGIQSGWWGSEWPNVKDVILKFAPTWVSHGILSDVTGVDMDASMRYTSLLKGIGSVQDYGLATFMPHLGWGMTALGATPDLIGGAFGTKTEGEVDQAIKKVVPKGWPSGVVDYMRHSDDNNTKAGAKGHALVPRGDAEALAPWFGSRSTKEAITMEAHLIAKQRDEEAKKLISRSAQFFSQGNEQQGLKLLNRLLEKHYNGDRDKLDKAINAQIAAEQIPMYIRDYVDATGNMSEDNQRRFVRDNQGDLLQKLFKK